MSDVTPNASWTCGVNKVRSFFITAYYIDFKQRKS